jgi:hypothetical protein
MMSFVEARQRGEIKAAAVSTSGYNSDEDVYATARVRCTQHTTMLQCHCCRKTYMPGLAMTAPVWA